MVIEESTARARELGVELKKVRERAKLSGHGLARQLGWPAPKISRLENGKRGITEVEVAIYLARCGATPAELDRLLALAQVSDADYRLQGHGAALPDELRSLIVLETTAEAIASYEPFFVPGLLQTEGYIRELLRVGGREPGRGFELRVDARLARQAILNRQWPPRMAFYLHENALRAMVGGVAVMYEQLLHLVLATSWPQCEIRIVPASAELTGLFGGGFQLFDFEAHPSVAFAETHTASVFLEDGIATYRHLLDGMASVALNGGQSRDWLAVLASEHDRVETDCDGGEGAPRIGLA